MFIVDYNRHHSLCVLLTSPTSSKNVNQLLNSQQVQLQRPGIQATGLQGNASTQMHAYPNQYTQQQQQQLQGQHQQLQLSSSQLPTQSFHSEHQQHPTQHPMHQQQQLQQKSGVNPLSQQHQQAQAQHIAQQQNLSIPAQSKINAYAQSLISLFATVYLLFISQSSLSSLKNFSSALILSPLSCSSK